MRSYREFEISLAARALRTDTAALPPDRASASRLRALSNQGVGAVARKRCESGSDAPGQRGVVLDGPDLTHKLAITTVIASLPAPTPTATYRKTSVGNVSFTTPFRTADGDSSSVRRTTLLLSASARPGSHSASPVGASGQLRPCSNPIATTTCRVRHLPYGRCSKSSNGQGTSGTEEPRADCGQQRGRPYAASTRRTSATCPDRLCFRYTCFSSQRT